jgi:6-phosphogluconolactonase (cycloisomerase 2 family)
MLALTVFAAVPRAGGQGNPFKASGPASENAASHQTLYASTGPTLTQYDVDTKAATLTAVGSITLPRNVQYAWPDPTHSVLYVAWSAATADRPFGEQGVTAYSINKHNGQLTQLGAPILLLKRPVHLSTDPNGRFLLVAHNNPPAGLTVWRINADGSLGGQIPQPGVVDGGIYAHQVMVDPDGKMAILVTRGNVPAEAPSGVEEPGALKVFHFDGDTGLLSNEVSLDVNGGFGFKPRHVDFYNRFVFLAVERQNQMMTYEKIDDQTLAPLPLFTKNTLADQANHNELIFPAQMVGPIHVSHDGRFVYIGNRNNGTVGGVFAGGENNVAVFSINKQTGEPTLIQNADTHGFVPRTLSFDKTGKMLIASNQSAVNVRNADGTITRIPTSLAVFRILNDGTLEYVRKYDNAGGTWAGFLAAP